MTHPLYHGSVTTLHTTQLTLMHNTGRSLAQATPICTVALKTCSNAFNSVHKKDIIYCSKQSIVNIKTMYKNSHQV